MSTSRTTTVITPSAVVMENKGLLPNTKATIVVPLRQVQVIQDNPPMFKGNVRLTGTGIGTVIPCNSKEEATRVAMVIRDAISRL